LPDGTAILDLPRSGILHVFSVYGWTDEGSIEPQVPKGEPSHDWTQALFNANGGTPLQRHQTPSEVNEFKAANVEFIPVICLPSHTEEPVVARRKWNSDVKERYDHLVCAFNTVRSYQLGNPARHLLLGFADYEQTFVDVVAEYNLQLLFQLAT